MNRKLQPSEADITLATPQFGEAAARRHRPVPSRGFLAVKRLFDITVALMAMPVVLGASLLLLPLNPLWNRGPLFYAQKRMGTGCRPFRAFKFRTMHAVPGIVRGPNDPLETDRITRLGGLLRRTRIDELPQFFNVLAGEMSLVGPRPDFWDHAIHYMDIIPGYRQRHAMRPGITGLAQVDGGYAEGINATILKTRYDLDYIERAGFRTDWYVLRRTIAVVLTGSGAR